MLFFSSLEGYLRFFMVNSKLKILYIYSTIYCRTPKEVLSNHRVPQNHGFEMITLAYTMNTEEVNSFETQSTSSPIDMVSYPRRPQFFCAYNFTFFK